MAKRRKLAGALAGLGEGLTNASGFMLRQRAQDRAQDRYDERQQANALALEGRQEAAALRQFALGIQGKVASGELDPDQAAAMLSQAIGEQVAPASFEGSRPSARRRMEGKLGTAIMGADAPEKVPSPEDVFGIASEVGVEAKLPSEWSEGMIPADNDPFQNATPLVREYGQRAETRRRALREKPTRQVTRKDPITGAPSIEMMSDYEMTEPIVTGPTSAQEGALKGAEEVAKDTAVLGNDALTKLKGTTEARLQNMVEALTRQAKVQTAAATAGATKRAGLAPDIVAAEVDRNRQLTAGKENSTESERRAATNWAPLVKAHATALELEKNGASTGAGDRMFTDWPVLNWMVDEKSQRYMQSAKDFISTLGLIRSGVTVRPDEADTLFSTMFRTDGDDATVLKNKQQSREVFLSAMQAMVGRSGDEAGRILAAAINQGQIPAAVLSSIQFDNEKLKRSLLENLSGIPQFDANGNPIGVRPK